MPGMLVTPVTSGLRREDHEVGVFLDTWGVQANPGTHSKTLFQKSQK